VQLAALQAQHAHPQVDDLGAEVRRDAAHVRRVGLLLALQQQGKVPA
jgi:hypothetical protein